MVLADPLLPAAPILGPAGGPAPLVACIGYHLSRMKLTIPVIVLFGTLAPSPSTLLVAQEAKPQNLPYVAVHNPEVLSVREATFMNADDRVIGLMSGKTAKAYPAGILAQHGLVQDDSPKGPIAVTW